MIENNIGLQQNYSEENCGEHYYEPINQKAFFKFTSKQYGDNETIH